MSTLVTAFVSDACWPHQSEVLIGGTACSQHGLFCCSGKAPGGSWQLDRLCQQQEERCQEVPLSLNWQQSLWLFSTDFISHRSGCIAMFKRKAEEEPAGKVWRWPALACLRIPAAHGRFFMFKERDGGL